MLGGLFKSRDTVTLFAIPGLCLITWFFSFYISNGSSEVYQESALMDLLLFQNLEIVHLRWLNFLFTCAGAYLLLYLNTLHEISDKLNNLCSMIYILCVSMLNLQSILHPVLVANLFLMYSFFRIFSTYREELAFPALFDSSFFIGFAVLIYKPFIVFLPIPFIGLIVFRPFHFREIVFVLIGFIASVALTLAILYLCYGDVFPFIYRYRLFFTPFSIDRFNRLDWIFNATCLLIFLLTLIYLINKGFGQKVKTQKIRIFLLWTLALGLIGLLFIDEQYIFAASVPVISFSLLCGYFLGSVRKKAGAEFLLLVFITAYVFSQLYFSGYL